MPRKSIKGIFSRPMQEEAIEPIIEDSKLPSMDAPGYEKSAKMPSGKGLKLMDKEDSDKAAALSKKGIKEGKLMAPFTKTTQKEKPMEEHEEQKKKTGRNAENAFYIVFRVRVQNGTMTVIGSKRVNSELTRQEEIVTAGLTYEAILNNSRLYVASIPDYGEQRSFPRPEGEPGETGHYITILPSFDLNVRIPGDRIKEKDLPKLQIKLYRFKEHVPSLKLMEEPLHKQFEKEIRVVAELDGINMAALSNDVKAAIKKSFQK